LGPPGSFDEARGTPHDLFAAEYTTYGSAVVPVTEHVVHGLTPPRVDTPEALVDVSEAMERSGLPDQLDVLIQALDFQDRPLDLDLQGCKVTLLRRR
jgi:hypothetical protein